MLGLSPLLQRATMAKALGFAFGLAGFIATRGFLPDAPAPLAWGVLALYVTIGGVVGIIGVIDRIPLFDAPLPPVLRGFTMGAWFTVLVILFSWNLLQDALANLTFVPEFLRSPVWMIADGAIAGAIIDVIVSSVIGNGARQLTES